MPDKKLTDNEIVKGKELIKMLQEAYNSYYDTSKGMPYNIDEILRESAFCLENCLNEINRLQAEIRVKNKLLDKAEEKFEQYEKREVEWGKTFEKQFKEIEKLKQNLEEAHIDIREHLAENERLKAKVNHYNYCYENFVNTPISRIKAEAYKEFAERLKMRAINRYNEFEDYQEYPYATITHIDELLKDLVGEDNG